MPAANHPWRDKTRDNRNAKRKQLAWLHKNGTNPQLQTNAPEDEEDRVVNSHFTDRLPGEYMEDPFSTLADPYELDY
mgnify:CR=1 FL=1